MRDGKVINTRCQTQDVTEQLRAEELLRQQDRQLAATYEQASIGIAEVDIEGKLLRVNAHLAAMMGHSPEEILGRSILTRLWPKMSRAMRPSFDGRSRGEIERYAIEKRFRRPDGSKIWVSIASSTVRDAGGRFLYAVRVQHDVTDRKGAEELLARRAEEQAATTNLPKASSIPQG